MTSDPSGGDRLPSQRATDAINQIIADVSAEITVRQGETKDRVSLKKNKRFAMAKSAQVSEAADLAAAGAKELKAAQETALREIAVAEAAGFVVAEDLSVLEASSQEPIRRPEADAYAAAIQAAAVYLEALDGRVAAQLNAAAVELQDLRDN